MKLLVPVAASEVPVSLSWVEIENPEWRSTERAEQAGEFQRRTDSRGAVRYLRLMDGAMMLARPQATLKRKGKR